MHWIFGTFFVRPDSRFAGQFGDTKELCPWVFGTCESGFFKREPEVTPIA